MTAPKQFAVPAAPTAPGRRKTLAGLAAITVEPRASMPRVIAKALRLAIVDGSLQPGAPLRQDALARHFAVSAIPVREALRQLESEGWITFEPNKGASVSPLLADSAREIYEIRASLESLALGLAAPNHTDASLDAAAELCAAAEQETDTALYVTRNERFHLSLYEPAARPRLLQLILPLHRQGERYLRLKFGLPSFKGTSDLEHAAILAALRRRDTVEAQTLLIRHLLNTGELLHRFLSSQPNAPAADAAPAAAQSATKSTAKPVAQSIRKSAGKLAGESTIKKGPVL